MSQSRHVLIIQDFSTDPCAKVDKDPDLKLIRVKIKYKKN